MVMYIDDMLITGPDDSSHMAAFEEVLGMK